MTLKQRCLFRKLKLNLLRFNMAKYESTQDQVTKEIAAMVEEMRDPDKHEEKRVKLELKKNVETTTKRYGL